MTTTWIISDTHFGHEKTCSVFTRSDGSPLRPFSNAEEMNEAMVDNWNSVVRHNDVVYHLGDVVINRKFLPIIHRLNGKKRLILGNHDHWSMQVLSEYFVDVYGCKVHKDMIMTHIPLHPDQIRRFHVNVHGHLHDEVVDDSRYLNVSVEQTNYTPITIEEVRERYKKNRNNAREI